MTSANDNVDPYDHPLAKRGELFFKTVEPNQIHSFHPDEEVEEHDEEEDDWVEEQRNLDKPAFFNGNNQIVRIFDEKCVICVYAFRQCHQCICEDCWTNSIVRMLKCVVCRT